MNPREYEEYVGKYYEKQGYKITLTPYSNDYGIDIIAVKDGRNKAVQAKMYGGTSSKVNRAMIFQLHGAMMNAKCDSAALVTNGRVLDNAMNAAQELGIEIIILDINATPAADNHGPKFMDIWENYIVPLAGKTIRLYRGKEIIIQTVDWGGINRITSNGNPQHIPIEPFKYAIDEILSNRKLYRSAIKNFDSGRYSSGIFAILAQVPLFTLEKDNLPYLQLKM
jgi:restriction system protein